MSRKQWGHGYHTGYAEGTKQGESAEPTLPFRLQTEVPLLNETWAFAAVEGVCEDHGGPYVVLEHTNQRACIRCLFHFTFVRGMEEEDREGAKCRRRDALPAEAWSEAFMQEADSRGSLGWILEQHGQLFWDVECLEIYFRGNGNRLAREVLQESETLRLLKAIAMKVTGVEMAVRIVDVPNQTSSVGGPDA